MSAVKILITDDEPQIRKFLKVALLSHDYEVIEAETGKDALRLLTTQPPDLLVLDLGLPDMEGIDLLKSLREWSQLPVIVLSARGQEKTKVEALEAGADDYLTKPFGTAELLARIKVALRHSPTSITENIFTLHELEIDFSKRQVRISGKPIKLTPTEYKLLTTMVQHAGKVVTHGQLLKEVWGKRSNDQGHYLRIYMQHLRQKLGDDALKPRFLETETGIGYRLKKE